MRSQILDHQIELDRPQTSFCDRSCSCELPDLELLKLQLTVHDQGSILLVEQCACFLRSFRSPALTYLHRLLAGIRLNSSLSFSLLRNPRIHHQQAYVQHLRRNEAYCSTDQPNDGRRPPNNRRHTPSGSRRHISCNCWAENA